MIRGFYRLYTARSTTDNPELLIFHRADHLITGAHLPQYLLSLANCFFSAVEGAIVRRLFPQLAGHKATPCSQ